MSYTGMSSIGILTTTFTPPPECFGTFYRSYDSTNIHLLNSVECFPPGYTSTGYYSSGSICPIGYFPAVPSPGNAVAVFECCPSFFDFSATADNGLLGVCTASVTSTTLTVLVTGNPSTQTSTQLYSYSTMVSASAIQLRFQASNSVTSSLSGSGSFDTSTSTISVPTVTSVATSVVTSTASSPTSTTVSGHSGAGLKVVIGLAVPMMTFVLAALVNTGLFI